MGSSLEKDFLDKEVSPELLAHESDEAVRKATLYLRTLPHFDKQEASKLAYNKL